MILFNMILSKSPRDRLSQRSIILHRMILGSLLITFGETTIDPPLLGLG